jgi:hypothetical protein
VGLVERLHGPDAFLESVDELAGKLNFAGLGFGDFSDQVYASLIIKDLISWPFLCEPSSVDGLDISSLESR